MASAVQARIQEIFKDRIKSASNGNNNGQAPYGFASTKSAYKGPDPYRVREQLTLLQNKWKEYGPKEFMFRMCWIQPKPPEKGERKVLPTPTKRWNRPLVPFLLNRIQSDIDSKLGIKNIFLKPRQAGYTTYMITRRLFLPCILNPGHNGLLIGQTSTKASDYFRILKRCLKWFGAIDPFDREKNTFCDELKQHLLHTSYSNRRELVFDAIDTVIGCETAENEEAGQGYSYSHVVATEIARWEHNPEATMANLKAAIPPGGTLDYESTANGWGGYFFEEAMRSRDVNNPYREFTYHFHEWWWHEEYYDDKPVPEESLTKEEQKLVMTHDLTLKQIAWRRRTKIDYRHEFDEKFPEDDITCFLLSGQNYFDKDILRERRLELNTYVPVQKLDRVTVFKKPKPHHEYIIGADVASGLDASEGKNDLDYSAACVLDKETGELVAVYKAHIIPEWYADDLAELGKRYNNALIGVERNEDGGAVLLNLEVGCMYGNLYKHRDWTRKDQKKIHHPGKTTRQEQNRLRELLGFPTNQKTRPLALNRARHFIAESPHLVHSVALIEECLTFVRDQKKRGRPAAAPGCHDDIVMSFAIGMYVRAVSLGYMVPEYSRSERYGDTPSEFAPDEPETEIQ
jgi:hypothetical protein